MNRATLTTIEVLATSATAEISLARRETEGQDAELVVVKRLLAHVLADEDYVSAFVEQSQHAALLDHPNVARVVEVQQEAQGCAVISRYISGENLKLIGERVRSGDAELPAPLACRILADLAGALQHAYHAPNPDGDRIGLLHRDVAPSNIIVGYDGRSRLIDFGIALADVANIYTAPAALKDKLAYMSPEQSRQAVVDARSDVFSLGVVGWELLTGRPLFHRDKQAAVQQALIEAIPEPPSALNGAVPPLVDDIIMTALAKRPEQRFPNADEMSDALRHAMQAIGEVGTHDFVARWMLSSFEHLHAQRLALEARAFDGAGGTPSVLAGNDTPQAADEASYDGASLVASEETEPTLVSKRRSERPSGTVPNAHASANAKARRKRLLLLVLALSFFALVAVGAVLLGIRSSETSTVQLAAEHQPIVVDASTATPAEEPTDRALLIKVEPEGARLLVDGTLHTASVRPTGAQVRVAPGVPVSIRVERDGYEPKEQQLRAPYRGQREIRIALNPVERANVSDAMAAEAEPDAQMSGLAVSAAPKEPSRPARRVASATSRRSQRGERRTARRAKALAASAATQDDRQATLLLIYSPKTAEVRIDGQRRTGRSPLRLNGLRAGAHAITVSAAGYRTVQRPVDLPSGKTTSLTIELPEKVAQLDIISVPPGAEISINGKPRGRAPISGLKVKPDETYAIRAQLRGYERWNTRVTPQEGPNPQVLAQLTPVAGAKPRTPPPAIARDIVVSRSMVGDAAQGSAIFRARCNACHGKEAKTISARRYTSSQWSRYFASRRHSKDAPFRKRFSRRDLADVKAFLMSHAADVNRATAAGVR
jgi:serine/threonine protein kinase/mono/diheme cytochrome c family protein